jgi:small GTP-binding protein
MNVGRPDVKRKILLLGAPGVGKSAIIMRFKDDIFLDYYEPTIHTIIRKMFMFNKQKVELEIIDIDGQTEYTLFSFSKFSIGIDGYIFCYSVENRYSFDLMKIIHAKLFTLVGRNLPKILIANKTDLNNRNVTYEEGYNYANEIRCPFFECSAKNNQNITKVFKSILVEINKYQSDIDLRSLTCIKLLELILRKEYFFLFLLYFLMILYIVIYAY